jgi:hypothetical protein
MDIITNHKPRPLIYGYELTELERANFDYMAPDELESAAFFKYKGDVYSMGDFMRTDGAQDLRAAGWHGFKTDSFFSAVLIKLSDCGDAVTVGLALS